MSLFKTQLFCVNLHRQLSPPKFNTFSREGSNTEQWHTTRSSLALKSCIQTQIMRKMESGQKSPSFCALLSVSFPASGWETPFGVVRYLLMPTGHGHGWKHSAMLTLTNPSEAQESNKRIMCDKLWLPFCYFHFLRHFFVDVFRICKKNNINRFLKLHFIYLD